MNELLLNALKMFSCGNITFFILMLYISNRTVIFLLNTKEKICLVLICT